MVKPDCVTQFMDNNAKLFAITSNGDGLASIPILTQKRTATIRWDINYKFSIERILDLPAILDCKVYIVCMQIGIPLHKLDAGEVLPVAHGLLEERLVGSTEDGIDLVGYDPIVPSSLLPHGHSSSPSLDWLPI